MLSSDLENAPDMVLVDTISTANSPFGFVVIPTIVAYNVGIIILFVQRNAGNYFSTLFTMDVGHTWENGIVIVTRCTEF